ncbi:hypothetical protein ACFC6L_30985 [Kitasatospora phosalacinea]|uniref:hypothetical protein n=1 Tax=Kitasatospora phosalacinea TaxID=2065 RepID=UPI0035DF06D3
MTGGGADTRALLRESDDPDWLEWPRDHDRAAVAARFRTPAARLEADFAVRCEAVPDQDSSEYGRVVVPAGATVRGTRLVVCVSNFGSPALVCADNPGAFSGTADARAEGELDVADLAKVERALGELGYVVVAEELLGCDYDGPSRLPGHVQRPTWVDRFFGIF